MTQRFLPPYSARQLAAWGVTAFERLDDPAGMVRGMTLRWSDVLHARAALSGPGVNPVFMIACDVLILDDDPVIDGTLHLFARHIEMEGVRQVSLPSAGDEATIVFQSLGGGAAGDGLTAGFFADPAAPTFATLTPQEGHPLTAYTLRGRGGATRQPWAIGNGAVTDAASFLDETAPLSLNLTSVFQAAVLLSPDRPEVSLAQLGWVSALAGSNAATFELGAQARTELGILAMSAQGLVAVPPLDFSVYAEAAHDRVTILRTQQANHDAWLRLGLTDENFLAQTTLTLGLQRNEAELAEALEDRARAALSDAQAAKAQAGVQLAALHRALSAAKDAFEAGIRSWRDDQTTQAALGLATGILTLGVEIGKLSIGVVGPELAPAPSGGGAAPTAADANKKTLDGIGQTLGSLGAIGAAGGQIYASAEALVATEAQASALQDLADETLNAVSAAGARTLGPGTLTGLDAVTGGSQVWERLLIAMNQVFDSQKTTLQQISGSDGFIVAFRQLVVGAEAYGKARLAEAQARGALAVSMLQTRTAERGVALAETTVEDMQARADLVDAIRQRVFGRLLDAKRSVYIALQQFRDAIAYYTDWQKVPSLPLISADTDSYLAAATAAANADLIFMDPAFAPSELERLRVRVPPTSIRRTEDGLIFQIEADDPQFTSIRRIRIDRIAVTLLDAGDEVVPARTAALATSGTYRAVGVDGATAVFTGNPHMRAIVYGSDGSTAVAGAVYGHLRDKLFKPTPFTTWTVRISPAAAASCVDHLELVLSGEAIGIA